MPKNTRGGNKHKKLKNHSEPIFNKKELRIAIPENSEFYAKVIKQMGCRRVRVLCSDKVRSCMIPGKMWKRVWLNEGDIILCQGYANSSVNDDVCVVCYKYTPTEISSLKNKGFLTFINNTEEIFDDNTENIDIDDNDVIDDIGDQQYYDIDEIPTDSDEEISNILDDL